MGRFSKVVFGRTRLPTVCVIYAGVHPPSRIDSVKQLFDESSETKEDFVKSAFAKKYGKEFLLCFGVYGAIGTIELLQCLKDGGTKAVVFVGSIGTKSLPVGTIVLPVTVIDRAGIVLLDNAEHTKTSANPSSLSALRRILKENQVDFEEATIVSVPSVLHGIESIIRFVEGRKDVAGVEMELSTFYHFAKKLGMKTYALVYVQDNAKHSIVDRPESLQRIRREAYLTVQKMVLELLRNQLS